mgnify:CR=1 FL=1
MKVTTKTDIKEFPLLNRGKVRDIYDIDDSTLLIVTTDRMSAFDVIMNEPVPYKGVILNQITLFWMKKFAHLVKNHLIERDVDKFPAALAPYREELEGRSVLVKKAKPHVGTDILKDVVREMRREIVKNGGEVHFRTALTGVSLKNGALTAVRADGMDIPCERAIIAVGHSARDTFLALHENGVYFEPKAFSVGVRIEHLQSELDRALYGKFAGHPLLPPAEYNLSRRADGRACYSFCMCPGGVVVAAQSEQNTVVTNGMSYHVRSGKNANAALAVSVDPEDFENGTPFGGVALQRQIEHAAYAQTGSYRAPCQRVGDFLADRPTKSLGAVEPTYPVGVEPGRAAASLPDFAQTMLRDSLPYFGRKIRGYDAADALLTGPETRTSSPVRMKRGEDLFGLGVAGLIPCGEGAGYAGGIMSAAVDGIRAAFRIMEEYKPE